MNKRVISTFFACASFIFYLGLWLFIQFVAQSTDSLFNNFYADTYGATALAGGLLGIFISFRWGFLKSYVGKAVALLSLGLLFQFLGQLSYTILFYAYNIENAYPAFGEIFYLASIPAYIVGTWYIAKASGYKFRSANLITKIVSILIPGGMIAISYLLFLKDYDTTDIPAINIFLDYFYPIGQALFVSVALVTFLGTRKVLGGIMRDRVLFVLFALVFQYIADSMFIYENITEKWYAGGLSDMMFLISYFLMTIALIQFEVQTISNIAQKKTVK